MATELECPVDFITVNENKIRLTAFSVLLLTVVYLLVPNPVIPAFLVVDFFLRGFNFGKYSLLHFISDSAVQLFSIKTKPVDQAPKRFAAKIGLIFSSSIFLLTIANYITAAGVIAGVLVVFAFLESFLGFCAGCYVYTFYGRMIASIKRPSPVAE